MQPALLLWLIAAIILLAGAELLARGGTVLIKRQRWIPPLLRSLPAFVIIYGAGANGSPEIALGSALGILAAQSLLLLGLGAVILPLRVTPLATKQALATSLLILLLIVFLRDRWLSGLEGALLAAATLAALSLRPDYPSPGPSYKKPCITCAIAYICVGAGLLITGSDIAVDSIAAIARWRGIPEAKAGLLWGGLLALPALAVELITWLRSRQAASALHGLLSANVIILLTLGLTCLSAEMPIGNSFSQRYLAMLLLVTAFTALACLRRTIGPFIGVAGIALWILAVI